MTPETLMGITAAKGVDLTAPPAGGIPEWTAVDAAHACSGLNDPRAYAAFAFRFAGDESQYNALLKALTQEARELAKAERWPATIEGKPYMDGLVRLLLFEEACAGRAPRQYQQIRMARLWPGLLGISEAAWDKTIERCYECLRTKFEYWCGIAHSHVRRRIAEDDLDQDVA